MRLKCLGPASTRLDWHEMAHWHEMAQMMADWHLRRLMPMPSSVRPGAEDAWCVCVSQNSDALANGCSQPHVRTWAGGVRPRLEVLLRGLSLCAHAWRSYLARCACHLMPRAVSLDVFVPPCLVSWRERLYQETIATIFNSMLVYTTVTPSAVLVSHGTHKHRGDANEQPVHEPRPDMPPLRHAHGRAGQRQIH